MRKNDEWIFAIRLALPRIPGIAGSHPKVASELLKEQIECTRFAHAFPVSHAENSQQCHVRLLAEACMLCQLLRTVIQSLDPVLPHQAARRPSQAVEEDRLNQLGIP